MRSFLSLNHQRVLKCKEQNSGKHKTLFHAAYTTRGAVGPVGSEGEIRAGEEPAREKRTNRRSQQKEKKRREGQANPDLPGKGWRRARVKGSKQTLAFTGSRG